MSDYKTILKMIEEVDPNDTAKLDEIDARVWCFLKSKYYDKAIFKFSSDIGLMQQTHYDGKFEQIAFKPYTRSRDALKSIRPHGWKFDIGPCGCKTYLSRASTNEFKTEFFSKELNIEELAELHAIIQAIAYERGES